MLGVAARDGPDAPAARDAFARRYYEPVCDYLTALSGSRDAAADLTQAFFTSRVLEGPILLQADRSLGSFRCYLKRAVRNFFIDAVRREQRLKRGGDAHAVPLDSAENLADVGVDSDPERTFHSAWVRALLREALARVHDDCIAHGQVSHLEIFMGRFLSEAGPVPSWAALGDAHGLDEKATRGRAETVARRFRRVLRDLLRVELGSAQAVDEDLAILQALLSRGDR
jgi:DNA-directed RNA polymerase specialized sigma24 family protein